MGGWYVEEVEIEYSNLLRKLLQCIQSDLINPKKNNFLQTLFDIENTELATNEFCKLEMQNIMFSMLKSVTNNSESSKVIKFACLGKKLLLDCSNDQNVYNLILKQGTGKTNLYSFHPTVQNYINKIYAHRKEKHSEELGLASENNIKFIDDVMKAYFH